MCVADCQRDWTDNPCRQRIVDHSTVGRVHRQGLILGHGRTRKFGRAHTRMAVAGLNSTVSFGWIVPICRSADTSSITRSHGRAWQSPDHRRAHRCRAPMSAAVRLQRLPMRTVVEGHEYAALGAGVEQRLAAGSSRTTLTKRRVGRPSRSLPGPCRRRVCDRCSGARRPAGGDRRRVGHRGSKWEGSMPLFSTRRQRLSG